MFQENLVFENQPPKTESTERLKKDVDKSRIAQNTTYKGVTDRKLWKAVARQEDPWTPKAGVKDLYVKPGKGGLGNEPDFSQT